MAIADDSGLDGVSMRAVADRVGVTPMALYRHFASKQALLDGMLERVVTSLPQPPGAWDQRLTALAYAYRQVSQRHPWSSPLLFSRPAITPDAIRVTEFIHEAIREAGVPEPQVARLERLVSTFVIGYAASEVLGRFAGRDLGAEFEADLTDLKRLITQAGTPAPGEDEAPPRPG